MKIYETIQQAKESEITTLPGIYYFRNKINNKYYIGQAINIRKRFSSHFIQIKKENNKYPIYRAILKYGIENFEYAVIGVFRTWESKEILKKKLDFLEKKYIKEYNSYGSTGYNQTLGGDGGVLGYKMTKEQRRIISINSKREANDGRNNIYVYDLLTQKEYLFSSSIEAGKYLNINGASLKNCKGNISKSYLNRYIIGRTKEELYLNTNYYNKYISMHEITKSSKVKNSGMFDNKYSLEEYTKIKNENLNLSATELAKLLGVCKKTLYNYEHQLPKELQTFNINRELIVWKIENIKTKEIYIVNVYEGSEFFQTSISNFRKTADRCHKDGHLYRKIFKINRMDGNNI